MKSVIDHSPAHTKDVLQNIGKLENIYNNMFAAMNEASVGKFPKEHIETNKLFIISYLVLIKNFHKNNCSH